MEDIHFDDKHCVRSCRQKGSGDARPRDSRSLVWLRNGRGLLESTCVIFSGRMHGGHVHTWPTVDAYKVFLQNIVEQIVEHYCAGAGPNNGHVLLFVGAVDANEHAVRVSSDHNGSVGRIAF